MERIDFKVVEILKSVSDSKLNNSKMNYVSPINLLSKEKLLSYMYA